MVAMRLAILTKHKSATIALCFCILLSGAFWSFGQIFAVTEDDWLEVIQTDSGCFINSTTPNGNLSFRFEFSKDWRNATVAFVNNTGEYSVEYILPVEVWEYEDENGNGYFDSSYLDWIAGKATENVSAYYKNFWFSEVTNIIVRRDSVGNVVCEWVVKGFAGLAYPWPDSGEEVCVPIEYSFHYFPVNGSLKNDFHIMNITARSATSRLFIEFAMRYTSTRNETVKIMIDGEPLNIDSITKPHKISSTTILLAVGDGIKGFFDFGGRCKINNSTANPVGVIVPWIQRGHQIFSPTYNYSSAIGIQLNYPHVNGTLAHDPSFGLKTQGRTVPRQPPVESRELPWKNPLIVGTVMFVMAAAIIIILRRRRKL